VFIFHSQTRAWTICCAIRNTHYAFAPRVTSTRYVKEHNPDSLVKRLRATAKNTVFSRKAHFVPDTIIARMDFHCKK
jgi:hypothetical protein